MGNTGISNRPYADMMNSSKGGSMVRTFASESTSPFTVLQGAKPPDLSEFRREEREERQASLMRVPKHKASAKPGSDTYQ